MQDRHAVRDVRCEKCGYDFRYRLFRRGEGKGPSPYYLNNKGAQRRAEKGAEQQLRKLVVYGVDPVACPDCGWFQKEMVDELRSRYYGWLYGISWTIGILLGVRRSSARRASAASTASSTPSASAS